MTGFRSGADTRRVRCVSAAFLLAVSLTAPAAAGAASRGSERGAEAESLYRRARAYDARGTVETRRFAMGLYEQCALLAPDRADVQLALARTYMQMGFLRQARKRFETASKLSPDNAEARAGIGSVWRRDYLKYLDRTTLRQAIDEFTEAVRIDPTLDEIWLQLVALTLEEGHPRASLAAAENVAAVAPARPEAMVALAHAAFRCGQVARADSLFQKAVPLLPRQVRERFDDIAPVASERDTATLRSLGPRERGDFVRRFWKEQDPDLATVENEAQLEYWSRVTQAYLLFYSRRRREWDQRGELYVRFGPPEVATYNPVGRRLTFYMGNYGAYPMNLLVWAYPSIGLEVTLQDRLLNEFYMPELSLVSDSDPVLAAGSVEEEGALQMSPSRRAVFPRLPPGVKPLPVRGLIARFEGDSGPRLLGAGTAAGSPGDSMWAEWVVLDSTSREVARGRIDPSPSGCDPAGAKVAEFTAELPAGAYQAGLTLRRSDGSRGLLRWSTQLPRAGQALALSDLVLSCGPPSVEGSADAPAVRISPNPAARVRSGEPVVAYFEIYHLSAGPDGLARFEVEYTVRSAERDERIWVQRLLAPRRPIPEVSASRREEHAGALRRQSITVPVPTLPAGRFLLEVRVRDLQAGSEAVRAAAFTKDAETASVAPANGPRSTP